MLMSRKSSLARVIIVAAIVVGASTFNAYYKRHRPASPSYQPGTQTSTSTVPELNGTKCHLRGELPDPVCTPGVADRSVTAENVASTICVSGYTATVRPPASYTSALKRQQMSDYGFTDSTRLHEEDHLISLELGGSPRDPANLWPEPGASPNPKDKIENRLHVAICAGQISLGEAQHRITTNWTTAADGL